MKRILVFIYLVVLMGLAYSQAPEWEWVVTGSGTGSSAINDVVSADNGNKYITGRYSGSCSLGNFDISSAQSSGFVACLDSSNVFQWVFPFELNNSHAHKPHITYTSDGYIYVAAYYLNSITIQDTVYPNAGSYDILLLKLDTSGQLIDCSVWGGSGDDYVYDIASDDMGNVYLCGQSTSTLLQFGDFSFISHASTDAFVVKVDSEGAVEWLSQAWSSAADYFYSIDIQGDEFCVSGSHGKTPSMNFGSIQVVSNYNWSFDGETDAIVAKGSISEGEWLWATDIENVQWNSYRCYVQDAKFDSNHNIIIAGLFPGVIMVGEFALGPYGDNCGTHFVASYNVSGECTWARAFGSNSAMSFPDMMRVAIDSRDNAFCTFYYYGTNYFNTVNIASLGSYDGFICKVNDSGEVQWAKSVAGIGTESAKSIIDSNDELLVFGGFTSQPTYWDSYTANATGGTEHFYIGKLDNTVPDFSVSSTSGYLPLTVQFTNESTGFPTSYQWDFDGNGIIDSTEPNPVFTYTQPGTYSVSLTTSDGIHFRTKTQSNLINAILRPDTDWLTALAFGGLGVDSITDLTHDTEGNVYVTGSFTESVVVEDITYYSQGQYDIFVAKYNSAGQCLWFRPAGGNGDENSNRIYLDTFNNLFIVGSFMSSSFNFPGLTPLSGPGINSSNIVYAYVAKLDTEGNWLWHIGAHSTGSGLCKVNDLCVDNDGSLYIAGAYWININFGVFSYSGSNSYDSFIAKFR